MTTQQEIIAELNSEVQTLLRDWVGDLTDCRNFDRPMAELQVVQAANLWFDEVEPADLI